MSSNDAAPAGPNPLRPYYIPKDPLENVMNFDVNEKPISSRAMKSSSFSAGDYFMDAATTSDMISAWLNELGTQYVSCLISQPFEVAKTILQVQYRPAGMTEAEEEKDFDGSSNTSEESDPEYFASATVQHESSRASTRPTDRAGFIYPSRDARPSWQLGQHKSSVRSVLSALWRKEGIWGIWKGQNAGFACYVLQTTLENWLGSLLSAILALPDPAVADISESIHPLASLGLVVTSSALSAIILAPLDILRVQQMVALAEDSHFLRFSYSSNLADYMCPSILVLPTALNAAVPSIIEHGSPWFVRQYMGVDAILHPTLFTACSFAADCVQLFVAWPIETVLRRGEAQLARPNKSVVQVGKYYGIVGTMWSIIRQEGASPLGVDGLYRGWKIGMWTIAGRAGLGLFGLEGSIGDNVEGEF